MQTEHREEDKVKVLIVEDEIVIAKDLQKNLERLGYSVPGLAVSAKQAMEKVREYHPDLVLMDIMLNDKEDGIEAAKKIRSDFDLPIIYLTAYSDNQTVKRLTATEPFGYILKPFDVNYVKVIIDIALYKHSLEREKERLIKELQNALEHVKRLKGLLPICAWCKKIRDDRGYWQEVETYLHEHSDVDFSHGICPECTEKFHRDFTEKHKKS